MTMDNLAHLLDRTIHPLQPFIIGVAVICWLIGLISWIRSVRAHGFSLVPPAPRRMFFVGLFLFAAIIAGEFAVGAFIKMAALNEIKPILSGELESISANGKPVTQSSDLFAALRVMHDTMGHHSHPTHSYDLTVRTSRGSTRLLLARDSADPHEYWVYYSDFYSTQLNDVAHVFTSALDRL